MKQLCAKYLAKRLTEMIPLALGSLALAVALLCGRAAAVTPWTLLINTISNVTATAQSRICAGPEMN